MPELVYSVADITTDIRAILEGRFSGVWIEGEVSNHREPGSGHHYFTLKDASAQLSCVLFRGGFEITSEAIEWTAGEDFRKYLCL